MYERMNTKRVIPLAAVVLFLILAYAFRFRQSPQPRITGSSPARVRVAVSFYPLLFLTSQIGGNLVDIVTLVPPGTEPHDFEPSTRDVADIQSVSLLILNGLGVEPWADKVKQTLPRSVPVLTVSDTIVPESTGKSPDPHLWLDPLYAKQISRRIADGLVAADPSHTDTYRTNLSMLERRLDELDASFKDGLATCQRREFVTSHAAFGYIAARYGLRQIAIAGISPDREPSLKELGEIAAFAKSNQVKYIFFETLSSPKLSEAIAREAGAETLVLNPIEGLTQQEQSAGADYISIQRENLTNLRRALSCN